MPLAPVNPKRRRWTLLGLAGFVVLAFAGAGVPQAGGCGGDQLRETGADEDELSDGGPSQRTSGGAGAALDGGLGASADAGAEAADDAGSGPIGRTPNPSLPRCDSFVYIDDGAFKLAGKPFALKGDNYRVELVALQVDAHAPTTSFPRVTVEGQTYDLFLAPSGQYQPDNNSWCRDPPAWNPDMRCCADGASCMAQLDADVARVQALGATTVRLLIDNFHFDANNLPRLDTGRIPYLWAPFSLDLQDAAQRKAVNHLILQAVQKLGAKGVRSLLLLNGKPYYKDQATQASWFKTFVGDLAATLKDEPWLVGYDFDNEPSWSSGAPQGYNFSIDKLQMRDLVQSWVDAVRRAGDTHHLTTLGNAHLLSSVDDWDPTVLPIDFNSYHVYPIKPKDQLRWPDVKDWIQREAFYASLGGCGMKCPYLGSYDGANCKVAE
ncbi:MAG: cellulase family glycosylhydrolase, partial [Deltaproteobacteria bacterium]|nr:cellulase family glycosylhydrolase [Deltaproteobacteria bacterium]